ncbi:alpha-factor pheromone receptor STE2 KNAG_0E03290 [Huiozyma naganishii CBS 8797]|uniref:Pheromone alpha factor receptor n=1 Tax=Huiozyma naganishii (strain ATCC MYA-139 / BCRC 22969 / CBS 8797 / KCTC 17520 / NBRC 10181 / NCYC 3082 / Yp74L-3) TaxID=1071383 RepID=J7RM21_HUIN7|nr:hypothetical protein KNAG_0E03290 [Kazachstania naganishii CBS 8797]CCK70588.1 hypothetical protein KNAG_0E03290 [Kazachstania naganishii CBS 8797]
MDSDGLPLQPISLAFDPTYNILNSTLGYLTIYGNDTATFYEVQSIINKTARESIAYGVCCGAVIVTFAVMWLVSDKRKTPIFILNQISLLFTFIQSALYFKYLFSYSNSLAYSLTGFSQKLTNYDRHITAAADLFKVFLVASIELSLVFQVRVMFSGDSFKKVGYSLFLLSVGIGLTTVAVYLASVIMIIIELYDNQLIRGPRFYNIANILFASSINFMTFILVVKLFLAIRSRRFLGLKQFDSFHILLIMSGHSLIIPSILTILAYALSTSGTDVLVTVSTLLVVLSLPLSSIWAHSSNTASNASTLGNDFNSTASGFYPNSSRSYLTQSLKSTPTTAKESMKDYQTRFRHLYRKEKTGDIEEEYSINSKHSDTDSSEVPKDPFYEISSSLSKEKSDKRNTTKGLVKKLELQESGEVDGSFRLSTPNTEADMEARKFWLDESPVSDQTRI